MYLQPYNFMRRVFFISFVLFFFPTSVFAGPASFSVAQSLVVASSSPGNSYVAGASVVLTAPVAGDFLACGGSIVTASSIEGDTLLLAGSIHSRASIEGDFRAIGGSITIDEAIAGDLFVAGFSIQDTGRVGGDTFIIGANTTLANGAEGPVTVYGNNVSLAGDFAGDVHIFAMGRLTLAPNTHIGGVLSYEAPETASIPKTAVIAKGVTYTNASYLPDVGTSRTLAFFSIWLFIIVRIIGALLLAGLLTGLFPRFAELLVTRLSVSRPRDLLLTLLLGFALCVATPIIILLLFLTFVGSGVALLLCILYTLLFLLALVYAGILLGGTLIRRFRKRERILWHDGVVGVLMLSIVALIPYIGLIAVFLVTLFSAGVLLQVFFRFAFSYEEDTTLF